MAHSNSNIAFVEEYFHEKGQRLTRKRKAVLEALFQVQKAISAYELVDYCKTHLNETVTAMSVYRILDFLQEMGLVHKLNLANKYVACSHIGHKHQNEMVQFLICNQCQDVKEINLASSTAKELQTIIVDKGFHLNAPQLEVNGTCDKCFSN